MLLGPRCLLWKKIKKEKADRETFKRILTEKGIDDANLRAKLWHSRPSDLNNDENKLRKAAKKFKAELPELIVRLALNRAMDREFGRKQQKRTSPALFGTFYLQRSYVII